MTTAIIEEVARFVAMKQKLGYRFKNRRSDTGELWPVRRRRERGIHSFRDRPQVGIGSGITASTRQ